VIDIGLIGCGRVVHENYAPTLVGRTEYRVRYVFDRDERQALSAAAIFGAESVSLERLLATADAVVVATPPSTHVELVERCLEQRVKIILCEKPFAPSFAAAADLVRRAEERGVGLYVGHLRRSFPHLRLARSLVSLGSIGAPRAFVASEGGRFRWESVSDYTGSSETGGVLWDTGSHTLDTALFVAGLDEPQVEGVKVVCVDRDQPEPSHHFSGDFVLDLGDSEVEGRLHLSRREALPNVVRIVGSRGEVSLSVRPDDRVRLTTDRGTVVLSAGIACGGILQHLDVQFRRVLLQQDAGDFDAKRFVGQTRVLEALSNA